MSVNRRVANDLLVRADQVMTGERTQPCPLDLDAWFVADDKPVMARRDLEHILRSELDRRPVAHRRPEASGQDDPHVPRFTPVTTNLGSDVVGPAPAGLDVSQPNRDVAQVDLLHRDPGEVHLHVRPVEVLHPNLRHSAFEHARKHLGDRLPLGGRRVVEDDDRAAVAGDPHRRGGGLVGDADRVVVGGLLVEGRSGRRPGAS